MLGGDGSSFQEDYQFITPQNDANELLAMLFGVNTSLLLSPEKFLQVINDEAPTFKESTSMATLSVTVLDTMLVGLDKLCAKITSASAEVAGISADFILTMHEVIAFSNVTSTFADRLRDNRDDVKIIGIAIDPDGFKCRFENTGKVMKEKIENTSLNFIIGTTVSFDLLVNSATNTVEMSSITGLTLDAPGPLPDQNIDFLSANSTTNKLTLKTS